MAITIPDATLGATFTNDITGVTYTYDGQKWVAEGGGGEPHDHDEYVSKSGDTMTGRLNVYPSSGTMPSAEFRPSPDAPNERAVIYTKDSKNDLAFCITAGGAPKAGKDKDHPFIAEFDRDLTTKKFVDDYFRGALYKTMFSNGYPAQDSSIVTIDTGGQGYTTLQPNSILKFSYNPSNRPPEIPAASDSTFTFTNDKPLLYILSKTSYGRGMLCCGNVAKWKYTPQYIEVTLGDRTSGGGKVSSGKEYFFVLPGLI